MLLRREIRPRISFGCRSQCRGPRWQRAPAPMRVTIRIKLRSACPSGMDCAAFTIRLSNTLTSGTRSPGPEDLAKSFTSLGPVMNLVPGQVDGGLDHVPHVAGGARVLLGTRNVLRSPMTLRTRSAPARFGQRLDQAPRFACAARTYPSRSSPTTKSRLALTYARGLLISCATPAASVPTDAMRSTRATAPRAACARSRRAPPRRCRHATRGVRIGEATRARFSARPSLRTPTSRPVRRSRLAARARDVGHQVPLPGGEQDRGGLVTDLPGRHPKISPARAFQLSNGAVGRRGRRSRRPTNRRWRPGAGAHPPPGRRASSSLPLLAPRSRARSGSPIPARETCRRSAAVTSARLATSSLATRAAPGSHRRRARSPGSPRRKLWRKAAPRAAGRAQEERGADATGCVIQAMVATASAVDTK